MPKKIICTVVYGLVTGATLFLLSAYAQNIFNQGLYAGQQSAHQQIQQAVFEQFQRNNSIEFLLGGEKIKLIPDVNKEDEQN